MKKSSGKQARAWPKVTRVRYRNGTFAWLVDTRLRGEGARIFKATQEEANEVARKARVRRLNEGTSYFTLGNDERLDAERALALLQPFGKTLIEAAQFYIPHLEAVENSRTIEEAAHAYEDNAAARSLSKSHMKDIRMRLGRLSRTFGQRMIADVGTGELDSWLQDLGVSGATRNGYRRHLLALWAFAGKRGWCDPKDAERTVLAKERSGDVEVLTPAEMQALLEASSPEILPVLAIGAFAGLRRAELGRLDWRHVDLSERYVEVAAENAKSARRRTVHMSDNLLNWLAPLVKTSGSVWPEREDRGRRLMEEAARVAGFGRPGSETPTELAAGIHLKPWPNNGLRHSFASYHIGHHNDAAKLALELGHTSTALIFAHYRRLVKPADALKYWNIVPAGSIDRI